MVDNKKEIIERIVSVRAELGLLSKDFAAKAGIDPKNYSSIESGKRSIGDRVMNDICRAFNISAVWLKTGKGEKYIIPSLPGELQNDTITMSREVFDLLKSQSDTILSQQRTIENLSKKIPDTAATA